MSALMTIPVGVLVERTKGTSQWIDHIWRPVAVLPGQPDTPPWTIVAETGDRTTFYAGAAEIALHRTETGNYRDNLASGSPSLWIVLRETGAEPPYALYCVTADPAEGEGMTAAANDLVEAVAMAEPIREQLAAFVAEHHVEEVFVKRQRDRADTEALGRRPPTPRGDEP